MNLNFFFLDVPNMIWKMNPIFCTNNWKNTWFAIIISCTNNCQNKNTKFLELLTSTSFLSPWKFQGFVQSHLHSKPWTWTWQLHSYVLLLLSQYGDPVGSAIVVGHSRGFFNSRGNVRKKIFNNVFFYDYVFANY